MDNFETIAITLFASVQKSLLKITKTKRGNQAISQQKTRKVKRCTNNAQYLHSFKILILKKLKIKENKIQNNIVKHRYTSAFRYFVKVYESLFNRNTGNSLATYLTFCESANYHDTG